MSRQAEEENLEQIQTLARAIDIDISKYQKYVIDATSIIKANASDENKEKYRSWLNSPIESVITNIKDAMTERFILANDEYKMFEVFYEKLNEITNKKFGIQIVFKNDSIEITALTKTPTDKETGKTFGDIHSAIKSCCQTLGHDWIRQARLGIIEEEEKPEEIQAELFSVNMQFIEKLKQNIFEVCFDLCKTEEEILYVYKNIETELQGHETFFSQNDMYQSTKEADITLYGQYLEKEKDSRLALITE